MHAQVMCCACRCSCCSWSHACPHCSCHCYRFCRRVSVASFLYLEVYSLHPPSVTVNCVGHCNFCTKLILRLIPRINWRNHCFRGFLRSISVKSIVAVMSQMRDATRNLASSTKTRKSFATNFGNELDPLHS